MRNITYKIEDNNKNTPFSVYAKHKDKKVGQILLDYSSSNNTALFLKRIDSFEGFSRTPEKVGVNMMALLCNNAISNGFYFLTLKSYPAPLPFYEKIGMKPVNRIPTNGTTLCSGCMHNMLNIIKKKYRDNVYSI